MPSLSTLLSTTSPLTDFAAASRVSAEPFTSPLTVSARTSPFTPVTERSPETEWISALAS